VLNKTLMALGGRPASGKSRLLAQLAQTGVYGVVQVDDISAHLWKINGARYFDLLGLAPCPGRAIRRRLLDRPDLLDTALEGLFPAYRSIPTSYAAALNEYLLEVGA
jgi:hypothetical protein